MKKLYGIFLVLSLIFASSIFVLVQKNQQVSELAPEDRKDAGAGLRLPPLVLKKYGPDNIRAGVEFNRQPNGECAIWAETENVTSTTILVLVFPQMLESAPHEHGNLITAVVPQKLFSVPGEFPLYLWDVKTNRKSKELKFIVK